MSLIEDSRKTENDVDIEDILANFFLKKIDMKSSKSESDTKYKKKQKHKKHKSKKHKHKSGRRSASSDRKSSKCLDIGCTSSSEEKDIKRLKKLKKLDVKDPNKFNSFLPVSIASNSAHTSKEISIQNNTNASVEIDIPYGPSLELLLLGTETKEDVECNKQHVLSSNQTNESSSHQLDTNSVCDSADFTIFNESVNALKDPGDSKLIACAIEKVECKEEDDVKKLVCNKELCSSPKQSVHKSETKGSDIGSAAIKEESADKTEKNCQEQTRSRSKWKSTNSKKSRSKSQDFRSRSRKRSLSRSRSKERSHSRNHSKSRHSSRSKTRRSRSKKRSRKSRSRSRSVRRCRLSRSWSYSKDRLKSKQDGKSRSRSNDRRRRSRSNSKEYSHHRSRKESDSANRSKRKRKSSSETKSKSKRRSRSSSKEKYSSSKRSKIDQAKIREIAEKNVLNMIQQGTLPEGISLEHFKKKELVSIKAGGKSVQELTDFCAKLSKKENEITEETSDANSAGNLEGEHDFIHHPFKLKEQSVIKLNIKNAVQIPIKSHAEKFAETAKLSSQFPVSSGNQHKQKELEWIPVEPGENKSSPKVNEVKSVVPVEPVLSVVKTAASKAVKSVAPLPTIGDIPSIPLPPTPVQPLPPPPLPPLPSSIPPLPTPPPPFQLLTANTTPIQSTDVHIPCTTSQSVNYPTLPFSGNLPVPACSSNQTEEVTATFSNNQPISASTVQIDFSSVFNKKFQAMQKLQADPTNAEALKAIQEAEAALQEWVNSCRVPGMFYGSTHVKPLPREQLGGFKDYRIKKDTFTRAAPVTEGKGMSLLKKMGWNPGEGLGKNKEGSLVPLMIDIKMDKKGLVSEGESGKNNVINAVKELQGKHPVSALMELCSKRKWKPPMYTIIKDAGPPHKKQFLFKVEVNGVDYQPVIPSSNKKVAKADAAIVCLQALKVFPS